jgi:hypothetical protein
VILIAALAAVVLVLIVIGLVVFGHVNLPFIGKPTITKGDPAYGWGITFPSAWARHEAEPPSGSSTIRYQSQGSGVGIRIEAEFLKGDMPPEGVRDPGVQRQLHDLIYRRSGDIGIKEGPIFGSVHGIPYAHYLLSFTDFSSGRPIPLEDSSYYLFNGANLEIVTFETTAAKFGEHASEFAKAIETFQSKHISSGGEPSPAAPTGTATP